MQSRSAAAATTVIASRCAWTLHNFRRNLIARVSGDGTPVVALGVELDGFGAKLRAQGVDFRPVPVPMRGVDPLGDARLLWAFYRRFRRLKPRVAHMFTIKPVVYGTLAAAFAGVPVRICTVTGLGHAFTEAGWAVRTLAETLYRVALAQAHLVFFQNAEDRALFVSRGLVAAEKTQVVSGSGVDLARFRPAPLRPGLGERPVRFLMLSRLLREKGVLEFVAAAERLAAEGANAEFRLVGALDTRNPTGLDPADLRRLQRSPVVWSGAVEDVREELEAADVVVLPSYREGTPRALLEAMAVGRPIVTTDAPGCRDLVQPGVNGFMAPPQDAEGLAEALRRALAAPGAFAAMGRAGRAFVEANYDEAAVIERTLRAYREGLGGGAR